MDCDQMKGELSKRSDNGESADTLAKEIWDFFCSVQ